MVDASESAEAAQANGVPPDDQLLPDAEHPGSFILVHRDVLVAGDDVVDARAGYDNSSGGLGQRAVTFELNTRGAVAFARVTRENIGKRFAIVLDNKVMSAPVIRSRFLAGTARLPAASVWMR